MNLKHFKRDEFVCSHTGKERMNYAFLQRLDELREHCGFPFRITSGYRDKTHPIEARKTKPGTHSEGIAADIACTDSWHRFLIVSWALSMGFTGIGIAHTFVHVDTRDDEARLWTYPG